MIDATKYGPGCPSIHHNPDVPAVTGEDCLNVNVYRPASSDEQLPVGLFIYGGSFAEGSNQGPFGIYNGSYMAGKHGILVIEVN